MVYHHRTATIALTLALALGVPATTAAAQQPNKPSSPASANPCSEVCSGGGYRVGDPGPCSEVCSGGGYGSVGRASIPPAVVRVVAHSGGFNWGDAGIGAGGMLALTVIGLGGALTLTRRRNHHTTTGMQANQATSSAPTGTRIR